MFQSWKNQRWTELIQRKPDLVSSEAELISANVFKVLWINAEKRQISEAALLSAGYLWDFNPGNMTVLRWPILRINCTK